MSVYDSIFDGNLTEITALKLRVKHLEDEGEKLNRQLEDQRLRVFVLEDQLKEMRGLPILPPYDVDQSIVLLADLLSNVKSPDIMLETRDVLETMRRLLLLICQKHGAIRPKNLDNK